MTELKDDGLAPSIEEIKALNGKVFAMLDEREEYVFNFFRDRGCKYGVSVTVNNEASPDELARAATQQTLKFWVRCSNCWIRKIRENEHSGNYPQRSREFSRKFGAS